MFEKKVGIKTLIILVMTLILPMLNATIVDGISLPAYKKERS